jgi:flagellar hook-length control protein FliK
LAETVGVWIVKESMTTRTTRLFERVEAALDIAEQGLDHVQTNLANAVERLEGVKAEQRKLAQEPQRANALRRLMARTVAPRIAPEFGDAHDTLHTVAEAAVVVDIVLAGGRDKGSATG